MGLFRVFAPSAQRGNTAERSWCAPADFASDLPPLPPSGCCQPPSGLADLPASASPVQSLTLRARRIQVGSARNQFDRSRTLPGVLPDKIGKHILRNGDHGFVVGHLEGATDVYLAALDQDGPVVGDEESRARAVEACPRADGLCDFHLEHKLYLSIKMSSILYGNLGNPILAES